MRAWNIVANQGMRIEEHMNPVTNASILQQLTAQNSNNPSHNKILHQVSSVKMKKNRIKKIHPSIIKMVC
jgi:hypothetical protein